MFLGSLCTGDDRVFDDGDGYHGHDYDGAGAGATDIDDVSLVVVYVSALSSLWIGSDANANEWAKGSEVAMAYCNGGGVTVLAQGSNDGEVEAADFWGYLPGKVTANRNERGVGPEAQDPSIPGR